MRGTARHKMGDYNGTIADFSEAVRLAPDYAAAYNDRGAVYFAHGFFESAFADFQKALSIDPENNMHRAGLAIVCYKLGKPARAQEIWYSLVLENKHYLSADLVGIELNWQPALVEAARELMQALF